MIGSAEVAVIRSVLARIPGHISAERRGEVEAELARHARTLDPGQLATPGKRILAYLDQDGVAPKDITEVDLRDSAQRDADALVELAERALGTGELPTEGGERPQVVVTVPLAVLQGQIGTGSLSFGGPINAEVARRIACDARVIPVVLGTRGEPLEVGRASHSVPVAIRRAVIVRDRGFAFPGCSVPARWCEIHHIKHWADLGPTSLSNCVLLCGRHHRLAHHSSWRIAMTSGIPEFHPPPWIGGAPRRNPLHLAPDLIRIRE